MKLLLLIVVVFAVAASFYADYRWRRWLAARQHNRARDDSR